MKKKNIFMVLLAILLCIGLIACTNNDSETIKSKEDTITVGLVSGSSPTDIFSIAKEVLEKEGYKIETKIFSDFNSPNAGTSDSSIDYNFYQHIAFLEEYNKSNDTDLVQVGEGVYKITYGLFSDKIKSIDDITDGMTIAIQNDNSNRRTSLIMLDKAGIIKINPDVEMPNLLDIESNPKNLKFVEMEETMIINSLKDVDLGCVSNSKWKASDRDPKEALLTEAMDDSTLVLVTRKGNENNEISKAIQDALTSEEVKAYIEENYDGVATPTF